MARRQDPIIDSRYILRNFDTPYWLRTIFYDPSEPCCIVDSSENIVKGDAAENVYTRFALSLRRLLALIARDIRITHVACLVTDLLASFAWFEVLQAADGGHNCSHVELYFQEAISRLQRLKAWIAANPESELTLIDLTIVRHPTVDL